MSDVKPLFDELNSNLELLLDKFKIEIGKANNGEDNSVNKYQNFVKRLFKVCYEFASEFDEEEENVYFLRQKLKESEDRYNLIMENASDVIAVFNDKLFVEAINEIALYRLSGYHREEIIGKSAFNFIHKDDFIIASTKLKEVLEKGTGKMEARFHHKDGHYFWVEASGKTFVDNNGETKGLAILRDISDHKKAEQTVEQKLLCQEVITKISNLFINISDLDYSINKSLEYIGQISEASRSYLFLVSEDQTSYSNTHEWCNKGVNSKKEEIQIIPLKAFPWIIRKLKNEGYVHIEDISKLPLEAKAEKEIYLRENVASLLCYPISIDNKFKGILGIENYESIKEWNDEIFTFLKVTSDIISRALMHQYVDAELIYSKNQLTLLNKNLEQKVEERTKELKQSEAKYRLITENANDLIVIVNSDFEYEYINEPVHQRLRGISKEDRIGKSILSIIHPKDQEKTLKALREGFTTGEGKIEVRLINKDNTYDWFEVRGKTFKDNDGNTKAILITRNINERKLTEEALIKSEKKYRIIFESIADPIHVIDADFKIRYINPAFERWLKSLNLDLNVIGKTPVEAWPFIGENVKEEYQKVFKTKQIDIKEDWAHVNDTYTYTEARKIPIIKSGNVVQVITIIRDITDRKNAELKLRSEKEKAQKYLDIAGVVILTLDIEGNITVLNKEGYKLLQYEEGELIGKNWFETCIPINNRKEVYGVFESLMRNELEITEYYENSILTKTGEEKIIAWKNTYIYDDNGKIIGTLSSGEDITERKKAELKIKESEEKYRHLFDTSPYYIILLDKEGNYIDCNNSTVDIYGYPKEDFFGKNFKEIPIIPFELVPSFENRMELLLKGGILPPIEFQPNRKDGKKIWINSQASLIKLDSEVFFYIIGQDITERKEAERKLKESEEKYRSLFENSPIALMDQDYSEMKKYVDHLKATGIKDFKKYLEDNPKEVLKIFTKVKLIDVNKKTLEVYKFNNKENFISRMNKRSEIPENKMTEEIFLDNKREILALINGDIMYESEITSTTSLGDTMHLYAKTSIVSGFESTWSNVIVSILDITEQKLMEEALIESEEKYRSFVENFQGIAFQGYADYSADFFHGAVEEITGYTAEDFTSGRIKLNQLFFPEDDSKLQEQELEFEKSLNYQSEYRIKAKDGTPHWILSKSQKFYDEKRKQEGARGILIDITDKKKAEQQLKESEEKFRNIADQSLMGIAIIQDDVYKYVNSAYVKATGYSQQEMLNWKPNEYQKLVHPEFLPLIIEQVAKKQRGELDAKDSYYYRGIRKDGQEIWTELYIKLITYNGRPADLITRIDRTDQKIAEEALKESEKKYRHLFESSPFFIGLVDENGILIDSNSSISKFLSMRTKEDVIGKNILDILSIKEENKEIIPILKNLFQEAYSNEQGKSHEFKLHRSIGGFMWLKVEGSTVEIKDQKLFQFIVQDITKRKIIEEELKESEIKYRHLFESSPYFIGVIDEKGVFVDCNSSISNFLSMRRKEDVIGKPISELLSIVEENKELLHLMKKVFQQPSNKDQRISHEFKLHRSVGGFLWLEAEGSTIEINDQKLFQFIIQDITNRKIIEESLKESEQKFRTIAEQSLMGIGILQDEELKYLNKKFANLYGYSVEEFSGMTFSEFLNRIHPEDRAKLIKKVEKRKDRTPDTITFYQFRSFKKTGELFWVNIYSRIISYQGKRASLFTILDITEMKTAELKLKESEVKFRNIAEQSFMGIIIRQHDSVKYVNDAALNIFGYSMEETLEWTTEYINEKFIHMEDLPYFMKNRRTERDADSEKKHYLSYRIITKSGNIRWIDQYSKIFLYQGKISELITIVDITEKKEAEKLIIEENKKLLELDKIRRDFLIRASHELKTPLNSVYSTSEFLIHYNEEILDEKLKKFLEIIYKGGKRLKLLIENLLDVSRIESDKIELNLTEKNIRKIIKNCIKEVDYLSKKRNISIIFEKSEDILINLDKIRMEQVFVNILVNAIKNTPVFGEVTINTLQEKDQLKIIFNDTGVGFTEEEKEKTFKKFGKIERYGQGMDIDTEGSGLGLFISKEIVELHGGKIELFSRGRYKGSTIIIQLPL